VPRFIEQKTLQSSEENMKRILTALILALPLAMTTLPALAQDAPSYAVAAANDDAQIRGRIVDFDGGYSVQVRDENGYIDRVQLHEGTIINPTGLTLAPGMIVSILGYNAGQVFAANEIDTPYTFFAGVPYYAGHPWNYYGPTISLGFFFGNTGWWHGAAFVGPTRFVAGARIYPAAHVIAAYHGGVFQGRTYVASPEHGGYHALAHPVAVHGEPRR